VKKVRFLTCTVKATFDQLDLLRSLLRAKLSRTIIPKGNAVHYFTLDRFTDCKIGFYEHYAVAYYTTQTIEHFWMITRQLQDEMTRIAENRK